MIMVLSGAVLSKKNICTFILLLFLTAFVIIADKFFSSSVLRIFNLCGIYIILALSLNLINGFAGLFSLGHAGFIALGAYTSALLTMSPASKQMNFFFTPIAAPLAKISLSFIPALIAAGLLAGLAGFLIGAPALLRLRGEYLAVVTLSFSEIIRVVITNLQSVTNGVLGLKGLPNYSTTCMIWGVAFISVVFIIALMNSAFGRSCKAVRDNEIAARAMGINAVRIKIISFTIASFMAGIGGALLAHMLSAIDPRMFTFTITYNVLLIVVLGGSGSISGSIIAAIVVTISMEALRFLDGPLNLLFIRTQGLPGLRMVLFSFLLLLVIIFRPQGLMGNRELSWDMLANLMKKRKPPDTYDASLK